MLNPIVNRSFSGSSVARSFSANDRELTVINPTITQDRQRQNNQQIRQVNTLTSEEITKTNSDTRAVNNPQASSNRSIRTNSNQRFTLSADQSARLDRLRNGGERSNSTNSSVNQYLETQSLSRRAEIESLVGVDLFV